MRLRERVANRVKILRDAFKKEIAAGESTKIDIVSMYASSGSRCATVSSDGVYDKKLTFYQIADLKLAEEAVATLSGPIGINGCKDGGERMRPSRAACFFRGRSSAAFALSDFHTAAMNNRGTKP